MSQKLTDLLIHITIIPGIPGSRYPVDSGTVILDDKIIKFDYRNPFYFHKHAELKSGDINSFSRDLGGLYIKHHSPSCPAIVRLRRRLTSQSSGAELDEVEKFLVKNQIPKTN